MGNACTTAPPETTTEADIEEKVKQKLERQHTKTLERANTETLKARRETIKLKKEKQNFQKLLAEKAGANYNAKTGIYAAQEPDVDLDEYAEKSLMEFVFENIADFADNIAVVDPDSGRSYKYAKLERLVTRVAAGLHDRGFRKGDVLAIMAPNVREFPIIFYAAASLGGIITTINPLYKKAAVLRQLNDTGAKYLAVTTATLATAIEAVEECKTIEEIFVFGSDSFSIPKDFKIKGGVTPFREVKGDKPPTVKINPKTDVVVIPYSSGTAGLPKGVMLTHANVIANCIQAANTLDLSADDVVLGMLPMFHMYGMFMFLVAALRTGCTLITMKKKFKLEELLDAMQEHKVSVAHLVPPIILAFAKVPLVDKYDLSSLRQIISGAAPLSHETAKACAERVGASIRQGYGMTELSPVATVGVADFEDKYGSVGRLLPNTQAKIVDEDGKNVGPNEKGELLIRGPQRMKGYLNNADATAEIIDDDGFLHTGDVAFCDNDGDFWIVDRVKELIKYKGFQVAPAELEGVLAEHPKIAAAGVIGVEDEGAGEIPVAYVELVEGCELTEREVMSFVAGKVAGHKKVRQVHFIDAVPKSPTGKILRRELAKLGQKAAGGEEGEADAKEPEAVKEAEKEPAKKEEEEEGESAKKEEEAPAKKEAAKEEEAPAEKAADEKADDKEAAAKESEADSAKADEPESPPAEKSDEEAAAAEPEEQKSSADPKPEKAGEADAPAAEKADGEAQGETSS